MGQINTLGSQIQQYNASRLQGGGPDPGADASLEHTLEQLSTLTNFTALSQPDGTVTVLVGGGIAAHGHRQPASITVSSQTQFRG